MAVARTVKPSRRAEYDDDGSSPAIVVPLPNTSGKDGPLEATLGSVCPPKSRSSFERRSRTRNALSSTPVSEPEPGSGQGSGGGSSGGGHPGRSAGGCGTVGLGLKSFLAYGPSARCGSVQTVRSSSA